MISGLWKLAIVEIDAATIEVFGCGESNEFAISGLVVFG